MTATMIADDDPQGSPLLARPWLTPGAMVPPMSSSVVAESTGKHRKPEWDDATADEPAADEPAAEPAAPVALAAPVATAVVTPDPLASIRPGDSFLVVGPVCGVPAVSADGQADICSRRPHSDHWWHIAVQDGRVRQVWAGSDGLVDPAPLADIRTTLDEVAALLADAVASSQTWPAQDQDGGR